MQFELYLRVLSQYGWERGGDNSVEECGELPSTGVLQGGAIIRTGA